MGASETMCNPYDKSVFTGLFSIIPIHAVRLIVDVPFDAMLKVCVGNAGFAGCSMVMLAASSNVANRSTIGLSP